MNRIFVLVIVASLLVLPSLGFAQESSSSEEETVYDFEGEDLTGVLLRPDGEQITGDQRGRTSSLINIRQDFIPEMLKSVENL